MTTGLSSIALQPGEQSGIRAICFHGFGGSLFGIQIVNLFLTLITLGVYSFWGRVRVRKYMMSQTEFEGDRFAYHGTGKELLIGWLKAVVILAIPTVALIWFSAGAFVYLVFASFMPVAVVNARRYRLSRTSWRGIRFSFRGPVLEFYMVSIRGWLLSLVTLGVAYPVWQNWRQTFLVSHSYYGNKRFAYDGSGQAMIWTFIFHVLLSIPTFGICWLWYWAKWQRYYWAHTTFGGARFRSSVTGGSLLTLSLVNVFLLLCTLGIAWSWVLVRNARYFTTHLCLEGPLDTAAILQEAQTASATGDILSGFFDLDFDIG
jgi:uncharacterized membrane protein YjgN (DUF898 family)